MVAAVDSVGHQLHQSLTGITALVLTSCVKFKTVKTVKTVIFQG